MAKKCVVNRDSKGEITSISVENLTRQVGEKSEILNTYLKNNKKSELAKKVKENRELYEMSIDNYINESISINQIMRDLGVKTKSEFYNLIGELGVPVKVSMNNDLFNEASEKIKNGMTKKEATEILKIPKLAYTAIRNGWNVETVGKFERGDSIKYSEIPQEVINSIIEDRRKGMPIQSLYAKYQISQNLIDRVLDRNNVRYIDRTVDTGIHFYKNTNRIPYQSEKLGKWIIGDSHYEIARFMELDADPNVVTYTRNVEGIKLENGRNYYPDVKVTYSDGRIEIEEIKPNFIINKAKAYTEMKSKGMTDSVIQKELNVADSIFTMISNTAMKINTAEEYYTERNISYKIMTEDDIDVNISDYSSISKLSKAERLELYRKQREGETIEEKEFIPSELYDQIKQQPFINPEQALDMYKNIYTDEMNYWKDDSESEC